MAGEGSGCRGEERAGPLREAQSGCFATSGAAARPPPASPGVGTVSQISGTRGSGGGAAGGGGESGNDIRGLCLGRGGLSPAGAAGAAGRGREDLGRASGPGSGAGPLPGGVSCRVRPPRLSPPLPAPLSGQLLVWSERRSLPAPSLPPTSLRPSPPRLEAARDPDAESWDPAARRPPETRRTRSSPR